jgi:RluA family pseudouridine synthase
MALAILHDDPDLVAVSKPAGLPTIPARDEDANACLHAMFERQLRIRLFVVHRLDRDTSGVILFAKSAESHRLLNIAFMERRVEKLYLALVAPPPASDSGTIDTPLHEARRGKSRPARGNEPGALPSRTDFTVMERFGKRAALLAVRPQTGRRHQVRVHLKSIGCPLLVDSLYGGDPIEDLIERLTLHASRITLVHPLTSAPLTVEAPLPEDMAEAVLFLRRTASP